jgi:phosphomannomutase
MAEAADAMTALDTAADAGQLSPSAVENVRTWLIEPHLEEYAPQIAEHLASGKWKELDDAFWTTIPFGTGGRRGRMYPIGCNAINDRTIGESAQGLADFIKEQEHDKPLGCAIAYDTRHQSRHFAELCAQIMAASGFTVYFLDGHRSTPELSFAVRYKECACGIIITASHNPPSDNAVKVYGPTGGQLLPPHDKQCIERMEQVTWIKRIGFEQGLEAGKIAYCQEEVDAAFFDAVESQAHPGPRELKIIYSPLHGVGGSAVPPVLEAAGFRDVEVFGPHAAPDPDFPNVPGHSANPENDAVFDIIIARAREAGAELILATDPDCDRLGCAAPRSLDKPDEWATLTGNQIGALLTDYLLDVARAAGTLTPDHFVAKTLVTTELIRRIADDYGVHTAGNLLVGFKWIGGEIDRLGPERFVFGAEESYGFLAGTHVRDKDAAVAALLVAELTARLKVEGRTLHEKLDELFARHGVHLEGQFSRQMPGEQGMDDMMALMAGFRTDPPETIAGLRVVRVRDYLGNTVFEIGGKPKPLDAPTGDMVILDLEADGNYVAVRPSGTEPKVKLYFFAYQPPEPDADLAAVKATLTARLDAMREQLGARAG